MYLLYIALWCLYSASVCCNDQRVDERSACCSALQGRITLMICAIINWLCYVCFLCVTACILCISTVFPPAAFTSAMCPENVTLFIFWITLSKISGLQQFNFLCTESWGNLQLVGYKFAHFTWKVSLHCLVKKNKNILNLGLLLLPASYRNMIMQEAQLSQRDRATLRVIEYFAKSLKVIRNDTVE